MPTELEVNTEQRARLAARLVADLRARSGDGVVQLAEAVGDPPPAPAPTVPPPPAVVPRPERFILFAGPLVLALLEGRKTVTRRLVKPQPKTAPPAGPSPHGIPGDRLRVREKWGYRDKFFDPRATGRGGGFVYAADGPPAGARYTAWRPSLHMPREACRIELEITSTRAERLHSLTAADALAEGCPPEQHADPIAWFRALWNGLVAFSRGPTWDADPWVWVIAFRVHRRAGGPRP
jgi:hypothetical protein